MELKLNIYKKDKTIEKTYIKQDYAVMYGTVEDLLDLLDLDALTNNSDTDSLIAAVARLLKSRKDVINPLLKDIFEGLTDDELRRTTAYEIISVIVGLTGFSLDQLKGLAFRGRK